MPVKHTTRDDGQQRIAKLLARAGVASRREVESELWRAAEREVDVIFLANAPPLLRFEISRDGVLLFQGGGRRSAGSPRAN